MLSLLKKIMTLCFTAILSLSIAGCTEGAGAVVGIIAALAGVAAISSGGSDDGGDSSSSGDSADDSEPTLPPSAQFPMPDSVLNSLTTTRYDGINDDLLTAGLGQTGLPTASPTFSNPVSPTAAELRRAAIVTQFNLFQDLRSQSGYGTLYGPAVAGRAAVPTNDGRVAGKEYLAYYDDGSERQNVAMLLQIPDTFSSSQPCLVAAPSPESRSVYGSIATAGEWGLKNRCAVVYTDKGTGIGLHDFTSDTVNLLDGTRTTVGNAGAQAHFQARGTENLDISAYNASSPFRVAHKHAHSQQNPESTWGRDVLNSINFAFYTLNLLENFGEVTSLSPSNTVVLAAGWGNGGAAALHATEQDTSNLIDGVVAAAPLINPAPLADSQGFIIRENSRRIANSVHSRQLFDIMTYFNLYQPCASALATGENSAAGRCTALQIRGLLTSVGLTNQVAEAQQLLIDYGAQRSSTALASFYYRTQYYASLAYTYANAYGRFSVVENLCGYSLGAAQGINPPVALNVQDRAVTFANGSGMPPALSEYITLIKNAGNNGAGINFRNSEDTNGIADEFLLGAICLRNLFTGTTAISKGLGILLTGEQLVQANRVQNGQAAVTATANLRNKPAIIVQGRDDPLASVNFYARAYYGRGQTTGLGATQLRYIEVKNAHHFDGYNQRFDLTTQVPLHYYFSAALDSMLDHLRNQRALPSSQVVATTAPSSRVVINRNNLPAIDSRDNCAIDFEVTSSRQLTIPACD